jgi:hypothetical protein
MSGGSATTDSGDAAVLLEGVRTLFNTDDNCDEAFLFAYHNQTVGTIYVGAQIGKPTVDSALQALARRLSTDNATGAFRTVAELCGRGHSEERVFGVVLETTGDIAVVQKMALEWKGKCGAGAGAGEAEPLASATVWEIAKMNAIDLDTNKTTTRLPLALRFLGHAHAHVHAHGTRGRHMGHGARRTRAYC